MIADSALCSIVTIYQRITVLHELHLVLNLHVLWKFCWIKLNDPLYIL